MGTSINLTMPLLRSLFTLLAWSILPCFLLSAEPVAALPPTVKRILVLGDSITYSGTYVTYLEGYLRTRHPDRKFEIINVGLPSETVSGLSEPDHAKGKFPRPVLRERLQRVLNAIQPDYVIACYGMNDGIYLPFASDRLHAFQTGIFELHAAIQRIGAGFLLVTPPHYDAKGDATNTYDHVLERYGQWELSLRDKGWNVVDLHRAMALALAERQRHDPTFAFSKDGVHPNSDGHWIIAREILRHLGANDIPANAIDVSVLGTSFRDPSPLLDRIRQQQTLRKDAWLNQTGHLRPGMKTSPPPEEIAHSTEVLEKEIQSLVDATRRS